MHDLTGPPFRADQVGSLLRPEAVKKAREAVAAGSLATAALREIEDEAIAEAVAKQEAVGLTAATDGEFRRASWNGDFLLRVSGTQAGAGPISRTTWFNDEGAALPGMPGMPAMPRPALGITGRIGLEDVIFGADFSYLRSVCTTAVPKLCIPSPSMIHYRGGDDAIDRSIYPDIEQFWADVVDVWVAELEALAAIGCEYLQLDDTSLAFLLDPREQADLLARGGDPSTQHARNVDTINKVVGRRPPNMKITLHTCRGNMHSSWAASGDYEPIAESVLGALRVDGLFLEFDDERSGSFEALRFVPDDVRVVLGLVTSKRAELERRDELLRRVEEANRYLPIDQLCLSTQCGFASTEIGNVLTEADQYAKLRLVVETAEEIWG